MQHTFLLQRGSPWQTEVRTAPVITRRASELFLAFPTGVWVRGRLQEQGWLKCSCLTEKPVLTRVTMNLSCVLGALCIIYPFPLGHSPSVRLGRDFCFVLFFERGFLWGGTFENLASFSYVTFCLPPGSPEPSRRMPQSQDCWDWLLCNWIKIDKHQSQSLNTLRW